MLLLLIQALGAFGGGGRTAGVCDGIRRGRRGAGEADVRESAEVGAGGAVAAEPGLCGGAGGVGPGCFRTVAGGVRGGGRGDALHGGRVMDAVDCREFGFAGGDGRAAARAGDGGADARAGSGDTQRGAGAVLRDLLHGAAVRGGAGPGEGAGALRAEHGAGGTGLPAGEGGVRGVLRALCLRPAALRGDAPRGSCRGTGVEGERARERGGEAARGVAPGEHGGFVRKGMGR